MTDQLFLSPPHMGRRERELVEEVFRSNWIAPTGPMVDAFEAGLSSLTGMASVSALSSGTAALHLALRLSDIQPGDEVWGSTMTFIGGVAPITYLGGRAVFLDVEPDYLLLDLDLLENELKRSERSGRCPKVVISTDLYGHVVDADRMRALADQFSFVWISDAAEAVGSYRDGRHAGKLADFAILSFNGNKIITTSGGGALASDNARMIERARILSTQARDPAPHYEHTTVGYNYRLSNVCAAIGVGQLEILAQHVQRRRAINAKYRERLNSVPGLSFTGEPDGMLANRWLTVVVIDPGEAGFSREDLRLKLDEQSIESRPFWKPMHMQPVFANARYLGGNQAERAFERGLCLPSGSSMTNSDLDRVCTVVETLAQR